MKSKKIVIILILKVLQKYTDAEHPMTQQQIIDKLHEEYGLNIDRGAVKRNIAELIEAGYSINYQEIKRVYKNPKTGEEEESSIFTNIYFIHDFSEPELRMLIDGILFSRSVPHKQRKDLINKLGRLSNINFNSRMNHIHCMSANAPQNPELFHTIDVLDEAITKHRQVEITYNQYGPDMKLHPSLTKDRKAKRQVLNPYQMVASEGRYYLICNNDNHESVGTYRIDRITEIQLLETHAKPQSMVKGLEHGLDLEDYIYQNLDMFASESCEVEFVTDSSLTGVIIDFFGRNVKIRKSEEDGTINCRVIASTKSIKRWAFMFSNVVRVISPQTLVNDIKAEIQKAEKNYSDDI